MPNALDSLVARVAGRGMSYRKVCDTVLLLGSLARHWVDAASCLAHPDRCASAPLSLANSSPRKHNRSCHFVFTSSAPRARLGIAEEVLDRALDVAARRKQRAHVARRVQEAELGQLRQLRLHVRSPSQVSMEGKAVCAWAAGSGDAGLTAKRSSGATPDAAAGAAGAPKVCWSCCSCCICRSRNSNQYRAHQ